MYLFIGQNTLVRSEDVIGVFDLDITSQSHVTRKYLNAAEKARQVVSATDDLPKSFVVCAEGGEQRVYLALPASSTLQKRSESAFYE